MSKLESELKLTSDIINLVSKQIEEGCAEEIRLKINNSIDSITPDLLGILDVKGYDIKRVADMDDNLKPTYYFVITKRGEQ